jgi:predicted metal-dependent phosphoesterase TrpH
MSGSRFLPQTAGRRRATFISMKTSKLTEVLERIEAWPPEVQDELADLALVLDAEVKDGAYQPAPEEVARNRRLRDLAEIGKRRYAPLKENLERDHFGAYVMINTDTSDYVVAPTTSEVYAAFVERFGEDASGWCTRIGVSVFATI